MKMEKKVTILITTKNRLEDLSISLNKIQHIIDRPDVACIICNDGSTDATFDFLENHYAHLQLIHNSSSRGYLWCRNELLKRVETPYAVSLDDDAHFVSQNPISSIVHHFEENPKCGVLAFRIFWGKEKIQDIPIDEVAQRVQGFVGCGHAWRMEAWNSIPPYPEWFLFYGEEEFASYNLFKNNWTVHYAPQVFVQHRVIVSERKNQKDYIIRLRNTLSSGWYLHLMFLPWKKGLHNLGYSIRSQIKRKVFKGDFRVVKALLLAKVDVVKNWDKIQQQKNPLTKKEYEIYKALPATRIYWNPIKRHNNIEL